MDTDYRCRRDRVRTPGHGGEDADAEAGPERWLISYADLITTLMVFFLALYVLQLAKTREAELKAFEARVVRNNPATAKGSVADGVANGREVARKNLLLQLEGMKDRKQITVGNGVQAVEIGIDARILFNSGDARLLPQSFDVLDEIAAALRNQADGNILVEGHTDNVGKPASNLILSQKRADAVKNYLVQKGLDANRLEAKGYDQEKPVADNSTPEGKAANRRVELKLSQQ